MNNNNKGNGTVKFGEALELSAQEWGPHLSGPSLAWFYSEGQGLANARGWWMLSFLRAAGLFLGLVPSSSWLLARPECYWVTTT